MTNKKINIAISKKALLDSLKTLAMDSTTDTNTDRLIGSLEYLVDELKKISKKEYREALK